MGAEEVAFGGGPAAFGADGEEAGELGRAKIAERGGGFVVVEGGGGGVRGMKFFEGAGEGGVVGDGGDAGGEGLFGSGDEVAAVFAGGPEFAFGVGGFVFFGGGEVEFGDAEGGGFLEDLPHGLGAAESDEEGNGVERWRVFRGAELEVEVGGGDFADEGFSAWAVEDAGIEIVAGLAAEGLEEVDGARVGEGEGVRDFRFGEKDQVHETRPEVGRFTRPGGLRS